MAQIYVSYSDSDHQTAEAIVGAIRQAGFDVVGNEDPVTGDSADCVVILWSKAAAANSLDRVQLEIRRALQAWASDRLVLATLDETPLPVGLRDLSAIHISGRDDFAAKQQLITSIQLVIIQARPLFVAQESTSVHLPANDQIDRFDPIYRLDRPAPAQVLRAPKFWLIIGSLTLFLCVIVALVTAEAKRSAARKAYDLTSVLRAEAPGDETLSATAASRLMANLPAADRQFVQRCLSTRPGISVREAIAELNGCEKAARAEEDRKRDAELGRKRAKAEAEAKLSNDEGQKSAFDEAARVPDLLFPMLSLAIGVLIGGVAVWIFLSRRRQRVVTPAIKTLLMNVPEAPNSQSQVFVSYSRQDERAVDALIKQIEELGHAIWIDRHSTGSQRYAAKIVEAIKHSRFVALMCSQNAFSSDHVLREVYIAGDLKKSFIVFLLEPGDLPNEILYFVSGFPRVAVNKMDVQTLRLEIARIVTTE